jgi:hypothetical protein
MKNPKQKGNTFERETAEALSLWLTEGKEKRACWRSDTSGAAATQWAKKKEEARYVKANAGDIRQIMDKGEYPALDKFFESFVVECKHYKEIDFYPPFNKTLTNFFDACLREKEATEKNSVLILKANNRKILFCQEQNTYHNPKANKLMTLYYKTLTMDVYLFDDVVASKHELPDRGKGNNEPHLTRSKEL